MSRVIRNPIRQGTPLASSGDTAMHHGGVVRTDFPDASEESAKAGAEAFTEAIRRGMDALENGTSEYAPDVEPVPGAPVEVFDIFDVHTGEHLMVWRVETRERSAHAN